MRAAWFPKNLVKRYRKVLEHQPAPNPVDCPCQSRRLSYYCSGRPELHIVWGGQVFGDFLPIRFLEETLMFSFVSGTESLEGCRYLAPLCLETPNAQPGRERLRHLVIGSSQGVRGAINHLHLLRYAEQREWSRLVTIPESGILITPEQGEVFSYLLRHRQMG